jgi:hypothetical protein
MEPGGFIREEKDKDNVFFEFRVGFKEKEIFSLFFEYN